MTDFPTPEGDLTAAESEELLLMCGHAPGPEPLSPAARAVLDAASNHWPGGSNHPSKRACVAAALRAVANYCPRERRILMTIADELESTS